MKKVSLKDIATKVGVSTALVSYVLNGKMEGRISEEMKARIKATAEELNYRPNQIARSLKTAKTSVIGLLLADIANPFSAQIARIIENEAHKYGYSVIIGSMDEDLKKTDELIRLFLDRQVDGLILSLPANAEDKIISLQKQNIPFVLLDRFFPEFETNVVALDNYSASQNAVQHMMNNNHKRIGVIAYKTTLFHLIERVRGAMNLVGDESLLQEINLNNIEADVETAIDNLIHRSYPIDSLYFTSNLLTIAGLKYLNKLNIKVPEQLAVVGFDKTDAFELFYTTLTYVSQPMEKFGETAVSFLIKTIEDGSFLQKVILPSELIVLNSSK